METYKHKWIIVIEADTLQGAKNAAWACWEAWDRGNEPLGGTTPESRGEKVAYNVRKFDNKNDN